MATDITFKVMWRPGDALYPKIWKAERRRADVNPYVTREMLEEVEALATPFINAVKHDRIDALDWDERYSPSENDEEFLARLAVNSDKTQKYATATAFDRYLVQQAAFDMTPFIVENLVSAITHKMASVGLERDPRIENLDEFFEDLKDGPDAEWESIRRDMIERIQAGRQEVIDYQYRLTNTA